MARVQHGDTANPPPTPPYKGGKISSRRVVAAGVPGVAAADARDALERAADGAVLLHGADEVDAAGGLEAAVAAQ